MTELPGVQPPHSPEAERAVLGMMLLERSAIEETLRVLGRDSSAFYQPAHRRIYEAIISLEEAGVAADVRTVAERLRGDPALEGVGGPAYLASLGEEAVSLAHTSAYAEILAQKFRLRRLIEACRRALEQAHQPAVDADDLVDETGQRIFEISARRSTSGPQPISRIVPGAFEWVGRQLKRREGEYPGIPSGLNDLDKVTGGFHDGDLVLIGGRPGWGKTTLAINFAEHAAIHLKKPVLFVSLEMRAEYLAARMICARAGISTDRVQKGYVGKEDIPKLHSAVGQLAAAPIWVDETSEIAPIELRGWARRLKQQHGLAMVVVDYIQLMLRRARPDETEQQELSSLSRALKLMARDLHLPVLAVSQLSRRPEQHERRTKRPDLADLRGSGSLEQDADVVLFIWPEEWLQGYKEGRLASEVPSETGEKAKIIVAKNRHGRDGVDVEVIFRRSVGRFDDPYRAAA